MSDYEQGYKDCADEILAYIDRTYKFTPQGVEEVLADICKQLIKRRDEVCKQNL